MQQIGLKTKRTRLFTTSFLILLIGFSCFIYKLYSDRVRAEAGIEKLHSFRSSNSSLDQDSLSSVGNSISKNFIYPNGKNKIVSSSFVNKNNAPLQEKFIPELNVKMPVIMYHHIRSWGGTDSDMEQGLRVSPSVLRDI